MNGLLARIQLVMCNLSYLKRYKVAFNGKVVGNVLLTVENCEPKDDKHTIGIVGNRNRTGRICHNAIGHYIWFIFGLDILVIKNFKIH